jgi:ATP-binding cassette subfamily B protein
MSFGRDVRGALFERVLSFSSRELNHFGAPSLITRNTNDVQQVQMLVLLSCTMFVAAPITMIGGIIMALRTDVGLSWLVAVAMPVLAFSIFLVIRKMGPLFRLMQPESTLSTGCCASRSQASSGSRVRPRTRTRRHGSHGPTPN